MWALGLPGHLDFHRAPLFSSYGTRAVIAVLDRLVPQVMHQDPYCLAHRAFWSVDDGSAHRRLRSIRCLSERYSALLFLRRDVEVSWLNQIEIYFSAPQRKALMPNAFTSLDDLALSLHTPFSASTKRFEWKFAHLELRQLIKSVQSPCPPCCQLAA